MEAFVNFDQTLAKFRSESTSESDKGTKFEKLMTNFLKTYQVYDQKFDKVWRWREFPFHGQISGRDVGIDLVAKTIEGEYWAIQCKCYQENAYVSKRELDSFIGSSGRSFKDDSGRKVNFSNRLWVSTTNNWSSEAEAELKNQIIGCVRLSLADLQSARVDWGKLYKGYSGKEARLPQKSLLGHQKEALEKSANYFEAHDRGKLVMACGTGKTFTALRIVERQAKGTGLALFLTPSIS
jgi:predicted helicase